MENYKSSQKHTEADSATAPKRKPTFSCKYSTELMESYYHSKLPNSMYCRDSEKVTWYWHSGNSIKNQESPENGEFKKTAKKLVGYVISQLLFKFQN